MKEIVMIVGLFGDEFVGITEGFNIDMACKVVAYLYKEDEGKRCQVNDLQIYIKSQMENNSWHKLLKDVIRIEDWVYISDFVCTISSKLSKHMTGLDLDDYIEVNYKIFRIVDVEFMKEMIGLWDEREMNLEYIYLKKNYEEIINEEAIRWIME